MKLTPQQTQARALDLACLSPQADPNPRVGCVIVGQDGTLLAEGYHRGAGTWHAEAAAINEAISAGVDVRGATAYVTLEPCAHQGRTPSCARALVRAGIARVVYGQADPNGQAAGGAQLLREAGIQVEQDSALAAGSRELNSDWTFSVTHGRPYVRWKFAATLDGFSAAPDGTSQWITGASARRDVQTWRARHGAVMVGTGTVLADDPHLTTRLPDGSPAAHQPLRVVVGNREIPSDARVLDDAAETLIVPGQDVRAALNVLHERGVHALWLEGGPTLAAAFLEEGVVDEVIAYLAPSFLGAGTAAAANFGAESITDLRRFEVRDIATIVTPQTGEPEQTDLRLILAPHRPATAVSAKEN